MGQYLAKPIERDDHGNAKRGHVVAVEKSGTEERERKAKRGMGRYLDRSE